MPAKGSAHLRQGEVTVEMVWDPPWTKERMSEEARMALDMW